MKKIKGRKNFKCRITSVLICAVMVLSMLLPSITISAEDVGNTTEAIVEPVAEEQGISRTADANTINDWKNFFADETDTSNAGKVWTDKTVSTGNLKVERLDGSIQAVEKKEEDNFLVGLSALSSMQSVTVIDKNPIDLMLVLDISGSMIDYVNTNNGRKSKTELLVKQVNNLMKTIFEMNPLNRVGIVCFSGGAGGESPIDSAFCLLPLGHYKTNSGNYMCYEKGDPPYEWPSVFLDTEIQDSNGISPEESGKKYEVRNNTYLQNGLLQGLESFLPNPGSTGNDEGRIPVFTLISDGAPTSVTWNYTKREESKTTPDNYDIRLTFLTQLTAAWVKKSLTESYPTTKPLFYTLGIEITLGDEESEYMQEILNPSLEQDLDIDGWWEQFLAAPLDSPITYTASGAPACTVTKVDNKLQEAEDRFYVDKYFSINSSQDFEDSFVQLIEEIKLHTEEPPLAETGALIFEDMLGEYMDVIHMSGVMYNGELDNGKTFAQYATQNEPEIINAIQDRLGITSEQATALLSNAHVTGQISYVGSKKFSNYIGWYADGNGTYIQPYVQGNNAPESAVYLNRSYFYSGGSNGGNLLGVEVRVEENLNTHEQKVRLSVPQSLLPLVKYDITTEEKDISNSTTVKTEAEPIYLFYEVGLKEEIQGYGVCNVRSDYPYVEEKETVKTTTFYTNKWASQGDSAEAQTTASYTLSDRNKYYYYTEVTPIYYKTDAGTYEPYTADDTPQVGDGNEYYYQKSIYHLEGGGEVCYLPIEDASFNHVSKEEKGSWIISPGTFREETLKTEEKDPNGFHTGTADYIRKPTHLAESGEIIEYLGNNGLLTVREGKLEISKIVEEFADGHDENTLFEFEIDLQPIEGEVLQGTISGEKTYGEITTAVVCPIEEGKIKFDLRANEKIELWISEERNVFLREVGESEDSYDETNITITQQEDTVEKEYTKELNFQIVTETGTQIVVENKLRSILIWFKKWNEKEEPLADAAFKLYRLKCSDPQNHTSKDHEQVIKEGTEQKCWEFLCETTSYIDEIWNEDGLLFETEEGTTNLFRKGIYRFVETKAPEGYLTPVGQWELTVYPETGRAWKIEPVPGPNGELPPATVYYDASTIVFKNYKPIDPPITGGRGIWQYFLLGAVITFGGVGLIAYQIRRKKHGNS